MLSTTVAAQGLEHPTGPVLLTVTGAITQTNVGNSAQFDREMLLALGTRDIDTHTIWTEGVQQFSGVPLKALADAVGISGGTLTAIAVNDYATDIPYSDVADDSALLALMRNGEPMSVRDKGPIWLVYPFDSDARFRAETYNARSIWQLTRIEARP